MVYSEDEDFAIFCNFASWDEYAASGKYPKQATLTQHRTAVNSIINRWIGCYNVDITDVRFLPWVKQLELDMIRRKHTREKDRKSVDDRGRYMPHDYMFKDERRECISIGIILAMSISLSSLLF